MARLYPMFVDLEGRKILVIGGGAIGQEKVESLLDTGARITVISPEVTDQIAIWEQQKRLKLERRKYELGDEKWAWMVICACGDPVVDKQVHGACHQRRIFCNVVDVTELCVFQVPAVCKRGRLQLAISTAGVSPALAKKIRQDLERQYDDSYEVLLDALADLRIHLKVTYPDDLKRRSKILTGFARSKALALIRSGDHAGLAGLLERFKQI